MRSNLLAPTAALAVFLAPCASRAVEPPTVAVPQEPAPPDAPPGAPPPSAAAPSALPAAPSAPPAPATLDVNAAPSPPGDIVWRRRYTEARALLLAGSFAEAAPLFDELSTTAPDPTARAMALEARALCLEWVSRDLVFVRRQDLGETTVTAKAQDRRTTDEIAVLYSTSVAYGLGTGGWLATFTKPDTAAGGILPALGLAGASAAGVYALDHAGKPLRYGVGQSIVSGLYLGLGEGVAWSAWNQARVRYDEEWEASGVATMIWGMSTAGAVAGGVLGSVRGTTPGRASFVTSAGLWTGGIFGLLGGAFTPDSDEEYRDDNALLTGAIALNAGAIAGVLAAGPVSPSIARVRFIDLGGAAGALLSGGLLWAAANDDVKPQALMGTLALGMTAGLGAGYWLTSGMEPDRTPAERSRADGAHVELALGPLPGGASVGAMGQF